MEFHLINAFYVSFGVECFVRLGGDKRNLFNFYDYDSFVSIASRTKTNPFSSFHNKWLIFSAHSYIRIGSNSSFALKWIMNWLFKFHLKVIQPFISFLFAPRLVQKFSAHIFFFFMMFWGRGNSLWFTYCGCLKGEKIFHCLCYEISITFKPTHISLESTILERIFFIYFPFFLLLFHLQNSCRKIMAKHQTAKKLTVNDLASVATEEKFIKRLKEQQNYKQEAEESRKTLHKRLHKILNRKHRRTHQQLNEVLQEEVRYFENISISRTLLIMKFSSYRILMTLMSNQESTINLEILVRNR